jgi:polyvinyl alcohol dehydrogenase (cytochrome)
MKKLSVLLLTMGALAATASMALPASAREGDRDWAMGGHDFNNSRFQDREKTIGVNNAGRLALKWQLATHGDISATPAVVDGALYVPDWAGYLYKVNAATGAVIWERKLGAYLGVPADSVSRASPAVDGRTLYLGTQIGARLLAINTATGALRWATAMDSHPLAILTQSPIVKSGVVYQGVASLEEGAAADPGYPCCTFRGSMNAVNATTGALIWKTYMLPDNGGVPGGYSGGAVWGSTPAIDPGTQDGDHGSQEGQQGSQGGQHGTQQATLYFSTGNNYSVPKAATDCQLAGGTLSQCISPDNHIDSIVALNAATGAIRWATGVQGFDAWTVACIVGFPSGTGNCPELAGPDFDFGAGPNLFRAKIGHKKRALVGAGAKSGIYWTLDAATGAVVWSNAAGPGSTLGGIEWGTATDGDRIYVAEANFDHHPNAIDGGVTLAGSFAALDPATGATIWEKAVPIHSFPFGLPFDLGFPLASPLGPVSVANGVMYGETMDGHHYALNAATGATLFDFAGAGSAIAGPAISNGVVYWGNGYGRLIPGLFQPGNVLYAFSVHGH